MHLSYIWATSNRKALPTILAQKFAGPSMFAAAAEDGEDSLINGRGDAYCGMLNASYNLGLRNMNPYIPEYPVGTPDEIASMISDFENIARILIGVGKLKIFSFGPRPQDFLACNAPIKPLFDLGVEIQENSELDLFEAFNSHANDPRIPAVIKEMEEELGKGNGYPGILPKLAQYELTLTDWMENNKGASEYVVFANKCWPAFQTQFGFVPCYVNSRFAARGIPISCETDIYGALSEYIITCATKMPATLLDINNTVPRDMYDNNKAKLGDHKLNDLFMGFHCGNTPSCSMKNYSMKYQLIMHRLLEPDKEPDITRGTLEGTMCTSGRHYLLQTPEYSGCGIKELCGGRRDYRPGSKVLRRHRRHFCHKGNGQVLQACTCCQKISAPRRSGLQTRRKGAVCSNEDAWSRGCSFQSARSHAVQG